MIIYYSQLIIYNPLSTIHYLHYMSLYHYHLKSFILRFMLRSHFTIHNAQSTIYNSLFTIYIVEVYKWQ